MKVLFSYKPLLNNKYYKVILIVLVGLWIFSDRIDLEISGLEKQFDAECMHSLWLLLHNVFSFLYASLTAAIVLLACWSIVTAYQKSKTLWLGAIIFLLMVLVLVLLHPYL
ncbi:MAG: hypothetical protein Q4D14_06280 [Bacteroidales bacterium]|nr:hypothetical protein [Bacteroidales bacterium]